MLLNESRVGRISARPLRRNVPKRRTQLITFANSEEILQNESVQFETWLVKTIRHDGEDLAHRHQVEALVELIAVFGELKAGRSRP